MAATMDRKNTVLSRAEIEDMIAHGKHIIIIEGKVLRTDPWLKYHPGGDKAIKHMVGRDATDEVNALHSAEARRRIDTYQIGRIEGAWQNFLPPIQGGHFRSLQEQEAGSHEDGSSASGSSGAPSPVFDPKIDSTQLRRRQAVSGRHSEASSSATSLSDLELEEPSMPSSKETFSEKTTREMVEADLAKYPPLDQATQKDIQAKYRKLNQRIKEEGLYQCNYWAYGKECIRYVSLLALSLVFLRLGWYGTSGAFLGATWHQLVFTAHDAGHMGITHDFHTDTVIGIIIADFIGGLSLGWWKHNHNVHHIVTNSPEHDPDIEHMPFFAISHRFFESLRSTYYERIMDYDAFAQFVVRYQHYLYYPILCFGRFNLYRLSWGFLLFGKGPRKGPAAWHRWLEIAGHVFFWTWFGYGMVYCSIPTMWDRFKFVMISHAITAILHVQITLSHFAMSTTDLGLAESFPQRMLRTTMDVDCPTWFDWFHGGLQFQAVHHLYPRIPRHNLRQTQRLIQDFCNDVGIPYALYGFVDGNKEVIGRLGEVSRQARILAECQQVVAKETVEHGFHEL